MKITNFLYDIQHARQYGCDCIIRLNGELVYVVNAERPRSREYIFYYVPLPTLYPLREVPTNTFSLKDNIDFNPGKLGFVNVTDLEDYHTAPFVYRNIRRSYKLGMSFRSISIDSHICGYRTYTDTNTLLSSQSFVDSMDDKFPSVEEILIEFNSNSSTLVRAFSKNFAINRDGKVFSSHNRQNPIGLMKKDVCQLNKKYFYLQQLAEKDGLKCEL